MPETDSGELDAAGTTGLPRGKQGLRLGGHVHHIAQAADPDGAVTKVEWDTDGDGAYDDAIGASIRLGRPAGVAPLGVRVTDENGARAVATVRVSVAR